LWSLFGSVDWRSLLTREDGVYDVGAFDIRSSPPRKTAFAKAAADLARSGSFDHPVLDGPGWWRRRSRFYSVNEPDRLEQESGCRKLLITGGTGTLGQAMARIARHRGLEHYLTRRAELDICSDRDIESTIARHRPWAVINAAGFVRVDDAEREADACLAANAEGPAKLAAACAAAAIPFVTFSSDLVFDGTIGRTYRESDPVCPTGAYGASKALAEQKVSAAGGRALIIRTSAFFGPWDRYNFAWKVLCALRRGEPVKAAAGQLVSPTFVPDLCHAVLDLLIDGETGIWHLTNMGEVSWHGFARLIGQSSGLDCSLVVADACDTRGNTSLASERGQLMRPLEPALHAFVRDVVAAPPDMGH
jgi:dTDP-4-dehydrorhamnose reductase